MLKEYIPLNIHSLRVYAITIWCKWKFNKCVVAYSTLLPPI